MKSEGQVKNVNKKARERYSLTGFFAVVVFTILFAAIAIIAVTIYLFSLSGYADRIPEFNLVSTLIAMVLISLILGAAVSLLLSRFPLKPVSALVDQINRLASGDFTARIKPKGAWADHRFVTEFVNNFNKLAEELENTEMLRSDFINNFSHEFKTPIVSIAGLAKLVNKPTVTEEQRSQYLKAIEEESLRLASMATNVLKLTKVENQKILTGRTEFNVSEQLRSCILLFESKWTEKELNLELSFDEHMLRANEELLREVWINLIENAIKFSPRGASVIVDIKESEKRIAVSITNTGAEISEEAQKKIWNKFYQGDLSHSASGNGIGLALVKRIVDLHGGTADVESANSKVTFTVSLPKKS